jgi:hypothetical protein
MKRSLLSYKRSKMHTIESVKKGHKISQICLDPTDQAHIRQIQDGLVVVELYVGTLSRWSSTQVAGGWSSRPVGGAQGWRVELEAGFGVEGEAAASGWRALAVASDCGIVVEGVGVEQVAAASGWNKAS